MGKKTKYAFIAAGILSVIVLQVFVLLKPASTGKKIQDALEATDTQNVILYNSFMFAMVNDGNLMENNQVTTNAKIPFFLFDSIGAPTLMICVPPSDDICTSCIDYAVNSVKNYFSDFSKNDRFIIFTHTADARVKGRVYNKRIFRCVADSCRLGIRNSSEQKPFYVVVDSDRQMSMFFIPNSLMPELTDRYLSIVQKKYSISEQPEKQLASE